MLGFGIAREQGRANLAPREVIKGQVSNGMLLAASDAATGKVKWTRHLPHANFGAATVANDVVFTSDFTGKIYAYSTDIGKRLWTAQAPAGINAFPAVTANMLLVGAGTPGLGTIKKPVFSITAYGLG